MGRIISWVSTGLLIHAVNQHTEAAMERQNMVVESKDSILALLSLRVYFRNNKMVMSSDNIYLPK